eukprot:gene12679-9071_t
MIRSEEEITDEKADQLIAGLEQSLQAQSKSRKEVAKTGVISDLFDKTILSQLEVAFANSKTGYYSLRAEEFRALIAEYIPVALVESVYRAIDVNDVGRVNYADFTNYLIASEAGSSFSARTVIAKLSFLHAQEEDSSLGIHRDAIDCLLYVRKPIPMVVSGGRDGQVGLWEPDSLLPIAFIDHRDKNAVYQEEFTRGMDTLMKAKISKNVKSHHKRVPAKMAVTSLASLFNWGLLCVGSADCAVTVYELATQDIIGRYSHMEDIPTAIECFQLTHSVSVSALGGGALGGGGANDQPSQAQAQAQEETITYLAIGDGRGFLHIVVLDGDFGNVAEVGSKKKNQTSFARSVEERRYLLRDVASDWITALKHIPEANALLAASRDGTVSFVDADKRVVLKVFRGHSPSAAPAPLGPAHGTTLHGHGSAHGSSSGLTGRSQSFSEHSGDARRGAPPAGGHPSAMQHSGYGDPAIGGVQCFDWSAFGKYVASASERVLLFWDPFTCETMTRMDNLRSPVVAVEVHDDSNKVFCALANKLVLLLHNITFEVLQVVADPTAYRPVNLLSAMAFAPDRHTLFTAGHKLAAWTLEKSAEDSEHGGAGRGAAAGAELASGRDEDLVAALYNGLFNQVLLVKSLGTLKIYQAETGELARQFSVRPLDPLTALPRSPQTDGVTGVCLPMVTQAALDRNQTRLLVLAADLSVQFWSVTDGSPLTQVAPQLFSTSLAHVYGNCRKQVTQLLHDVVSVRVSGEGAGAERTRQHKLLLLGTSLGHVCGYQEAHAAIDEIPTTFLRLAEDNAPPPPSPSPSPAAVAWSAEEAARRRRPSHGHGHGHRSQLELLRGRPAAQVGGGGDPDAVLWMRPLPQSASLLVAYLSGRLSLWDLEHNRRLRDVSVASMGAILNGMRRKKQPPSAGRAGAATFADVSGGFAAKAAPAATTSTASAASAAAAAQRGDEAAHATSSGPRRRLHHAHSHSSSHSHNAAEGSADEDGDSDGDERSQASSALQPQ